MSMPNQQLTDVPEWLHWTAAVIGGGAGLKLLEWWLRRRKQVFDEVTSERQQLAVARKATLEELLTRIEAHEGRETELRCRVEAQEKQLAEVRAELILAHRENELLRERIRALADIMREQGIGLSLDDLSLDDFGLDDFGLDESEAATDKEREDENA